MLSSTPTSCTTQTWPASSLFLPFRPFRTSRARTVGSLKRDLTSTAGARALTQAIADACRDEGPASVVAEATQAAASSEVQLLNLNGFRTSGGCGGADHAAWSTAATVVVAPESDDDDEQA